MALASSARCLGSGRTQEKDKWSNVIARDYPYDTIDGTGVVLRAVWTDDIVYTHFHHSAPRRPHSSKRAKFYSLFTRGRKL